MDTTKGITAKTKKIYGDYEQIYSMREKNCKNKGSDMVFVNSKGKELHLPQDSAEISKLYPSFSFDNTNCFNPCDSKCDITITG